MNRCWVGPSLQTGNAVYISPRSDRITQSAIPAQFMSTMRAGLSTTPASDGSFSQNVQRLALYAQDSWRASAASHAQLRACATQTTFGLFTASGRSQTANPALLSLPSLGFAIERAPHDDRKQFGPRLGLAYSPGAVASTVLRAGFGLFYNDLAQNGWAAAFQAVNRRDAQSLRPR